MLVLNFINNVLKGFLFALVALLIRPELIQRVGSALSDGLCLSVVSAAHISEHPNQQPGHKIQITMGSTEARVDYMGSSILMGVFSNADLQLQDEWKVNLCAVDSSLSEKRYSCCCSGVTTRWQQTHWCNPALQRTFRNFSASIEEKSTENKNSSSLEKRMEKKK